MSLKAIQKVTEVEQEMRTRKAAAEIEARQMISAAEEDGLLCLEKTRSKAAEQAKAYLKEAEKRAEAKAAEIQSAVVAESNVLRQEAEKHLDEAAEFIVRRVVNR